MNIWEWFPRARPSPEPTVATLPNGTLHHAPFDSLGELREAGRFLVMTPAGDLIVGPALENTDMASLADRWRKFRYDMIYLREAINAGTIKIAV